MHPLANWTSCSCGCPGPSLERDGVRAVLIGGVLNGGWVWAVEVRKGEGWDTVAAEWDPMTIDAAKSGAEDEFSKHLTGHDRMEWLRLKPVS